MWIPIANVQSTVQFPPSETNRIRANVVAQRTSSFSGHLFEVGGLGSISHDAVRCPQFQFVPFDEHP